MDKLIRQFFGDAQKLCLNETEKSHTWDSISQRTMGELTPLSSREKEEGFAFLMTHMQKHPLPLQKHPVRYFFSLHRVAAMAMSVALLISASGGGIVYAAESAMPEDVLYPVKLHFNEPFRDVLHRKPADRAQWEQQKIDRRLREAEHLSQRPEFTEDRRQMLERHLEERLSMFQQYAKSLPDEMRAELEEAIEKRFDEHEQFLQRVEEGMESRQGIHKFKERMVEMHGNIRSQRPPMPPSIQLRQGGTPTSRIPVRTNPSTQRSINR